jgi:hypothetical protein
LKQFGAELIKNQEVIKANYEAMAMNIESMVDYSSLTEEEAQQAKNLYDGGIQEAISESIDKTYANLDLVSGGSDG